MTEIQAPQPAPAGQPVAWCELTAGGQIAYFDGKPMVMPGPVGNDCHPHPLYVGGAPAPAVGVLTDEQIDALAIQWADNGIQFRTIGNGSQQQFVTLTPNRLRLLVRAALAAQPAPKTVPQGYRLIPEEFMDWVSALPEGKAQRRLEWLHSSESNDVDGWTWGVYRVKYDEAGQMVSALHTFSDFSDLDAAMAASQPPVQPLGAKEQP